MGGRFNNIDGRHCRARPVQALDGQQASTRIPFGPGRVISSIGSRNMRVQLRMVSIIMAENSLMAPRGESHAARWEGPRFGARGWTACLPSAHLAQPALVRIRAGASTAKPR